MARRRKVSRRDFLWLSAATGSAAALAACGGSAARGGRGGPARAAGAPAPSAPAPAAGAQGGSPSGAPIKIGASVSTTGSNGRTGLYQQEAYQLWEKQVNQRGGLLGRPVE